MVAPLPVARLHQIAGEFGLSVDHDGPPGEAGEVDAQPAAAESETEAAMHQPFRMQPAGDAGPFGEPDETLLQYAGADAAEHMVARLPLEDQRFDAGEPEQPAEQQSGRACPDDRDLCAHGSLLPRPGALDPCRPRLSDAVEPHQGRRDPRRPSSARRGRRRDAGPATADREPSATTASAAARGM